MIILDTNVISEAAKAGVDPAVENWLNSQPIGTFYGTAITVGEILYGIERLPQGRRQDALHTDMQRLLDRYFGNRILAFDTEAAVAYSKLIAFAESRGRSIPMADGQIAAIAKVHGFTVATRDTSPFQAAGVPVINPWAI